MESVVVVAAITEGGWLALCAGITAVGGVAAAWVSARRKKDAEVAHGTLLEAVLEMKGDLAVVKTEAEANAVWRASHTEQDLRVARWLGVPDEVVRG